MAATKFSEKNYLKNSYQQKLLNKSNFCYLTAVQCAYEGGFESLRPKREDDIRQYHRLGITVLVFR